LVEEYEEFVEQDDYEDAYEDELEYVEIKGSEEEINNRKKLYMDNDDSDQIQNQNSVNQIDEKNNIDLKQKIPLSHWDFIKWFTSKKFSIRKNFISLRIN